LEGTIAMPQVSQLFFKAAILFLLLGIGMGLQMMR
jgi:hypothetical protein